MKKSDLSGHAYFHQAPTHTNPTDGLLLDLAIGNHTMRILILGVAGMLGHKVYQILRDRFDTWCTLRGNPKEFDSIGLFRPDRLLAGVDATHIDSVIGALAASKPDLVINCIGIVKQTALAKAPLESIAINALFPHQLARLCGMIGARLIHVSTDCVFSGRKGNYREDDMSDAEDLYGRTKFLGEVIGPGCLTLRTSIIGRELRGNLSLIEWFISQRGGRVRGYSRAIYSGLTIGVFTELIADLIENHPDLSGLWHVSSAPISKYDLLRLVNEAFELHITIDKDESFVCDRSLDGSRFRKAINYTPPSWEQMIEGLAADRVLYSQ